MSKVNMKNKEKIKIPRNLIYISTILLTIIVLFFIWFGVEYSNNKVKPFKDEFTDTKYKALKAKNITDFTFDFYCTEYFSSSTKQVKFQATAYDKKDGVGKITNVNLKMMMAADWVGYTSNVSSSTTLKDSDKWWSSTNHEEGKDDPTSFTKASLLVTGIDKTYPIKSFFFGMKVTPKAYVLLTYTQTKNGKATDKKYLIEYSYKEYFKDKITLVA